MGASEVLRLIASAGLTIKVEDRKLVVRPATRLTPDLSVLIKSAAAELLATLAPEPPRPFRMTVEQEERAPGETWDETARLQVVSRTLLFKKRSVNATNADDLAERLHLRDIERAAGLDDRVMCIECRHYRPTRSDDCANALIAGSRLRGPHMATTLQRCSGFAPAPLPHSGSCGPEDGP